MCHPAVPSVTQRDLVVVQRWLLLQAVETVTTQARTEAAAAADCGGSAESRCSDLIKQCVCSPTRHPGSFRCRHHHADYVWGARITKK